MRGTGRREFIAGGVSAMALGALGREAGQTEGVRAVLLQLGRNMWCEWLPEPLMSASCIAPEKRPDLKLAVNEDLWRRVTGRMAEKRLNMVVIDLGEALAYPSHPELAVEGSWSPEKLRGELRRLRALGLEPIPKLNFSATHDGWLKDYHRMLTLPKWYEVARDLINDVVDIFERPRFFHLGWDEESVGYAANRNYFVMREGEMWWHDFLYTVKCVEDRGVRPWVWSDKGWYDADYVKRCPKSVVQSDWYYDECLGGFDVNGYKAAHHIRRLRQYYQLEEAGFDQIPCGTNWVGSARKAAGCGADDVIGKLVRLGREVIADSRRLGFMMASWAACDTEEHAAFAMRGVDLLADALEGKVHSPGEVKS